MPKFDLDRRSWFKLAVTAGAVLSRWVPTDRRARVVHPWIGAAALLLCGVQVFLGLQIMP